MQSVKLSSTHIEALKWLALLSMLLDHTARLCLDMQTPLAISLTGIGRLAYPLFAFLLAHNLMHFSQSPKRYGLWLLGFAILSQPVFQTAFPETFLLNILFTLSAGFLLLLALRNWQQQRTPQRSTALILLCFIFGVLGSFFSYAAVGIVLPMAWWLWLQKPRHGGIVALLLFLLLALNGFTPQALTALLVLPLVQAMQPLKPLPIPRLPRLFFYGFYPLHLLILLWLQP